MITALLSAAIAISSTVELNPTDDIWAYPHAEDQMTDPYLRIWGQEGKSVWPAGEDGEAYGISLLKFDLSKIEVGKKLKSAKLILTHAEGIGITAEISKKMPLEVRWVDGSFKERGWEYSQITKLRPKDDAKSIIATGFLSGFTADQPHPMEVDMFAGPLNFADIYLEAAKAKPAELRFALTSTISPAELGRTAVYKFYTKDCENPKYKPVLRLEFE